MPDFIDQSDERQEVQDAARLAAIRANAVLQPGVAGDCDLCGDWASRLVTGACAPCRDKHKLP